MKYFISNNLFSYGNYENSSLEECIDYCKKQKVLGIDIETSRKYPKGRFNEKKYKPGLDPYLSRICLFQIGTLEDQFIIDTRVVDISPLKEILESKDILKVGHNLKFETGHLYVNYKIKIQNIWDTMICERILYNGYNISYSLENLSYRYLDSTKKKIQTNLFEEKEKEYTLEYNSDEVNWLDSDFSFVIDKSIRLNFVEHGDAPFTQNQLEYATDDILMPLLIYDKQKEGVDLEDGLYKPDVGFQIENAFVSTLGIIELKGVKVDAKNWLELYEKNLKKRWEIKDILDSFVKKYYVSFSSQLNLFTQSNECSIEWESSKQVIDFFKHLKICPKEYSKQTKKVEYTVGAKSLFRLLTNENKDHFYQMNLQEFKDKDDTQSLIINYLIYKKYQLLTTTFGKEWLEWIHPITGRVHCNFKQLLNTGRMAAVNPNLQQLPSGKEFRSLFISDYDYSLTAVDYDTQEVKIAAVAHNEPLLKDFFVSEHPIFKKDFHSFTASKIFSIIRNKPDLILSKKDKKERNIAKAMTFKLFYGGAAYTISQDLGVSLEEAEKFVKAYFNAFPGLAESFERAKKNAVEKGWVEICLFTKKRYFFPEFEEMKSLQKEFFSYFGKDYQKLSQKNRTLYKKNLYKEKPEIKKLNLKAGKLRGKLERLALNYIIQGSCSVMMKLATIIVEKQITNLTEGVLLLIHDEMLCQFKTTEIKEKNLVAENAMLQAGTFFTNELSMSATGEFGNYWIH